LILDRLARGRRVRGDHGGLRLRKVLRGVLLVGLLLVTSAAASKAPPSGTPAAATKAPPPPPVNAPAPRGASLLVPAIPDTLPPESEAAPFLVPGRPIALDSGRTREARARVYLAMAEDMERRGQLSTALAGYEGALALDTTLTGIAFRMGRIYQTMDDPERAARSFARELKRDPKNGAAAIELGISLAQMGRQGDAIARLEALTRKTPRDDRAWSALGFAYHAAARPRDAETAMRKALALPPERAEEHRDLGALFASQGRDREARAEFQKAMKLDPKDAAAWVNLGNLERRAGRDEQALAAYQAAEARDSSQALALQGEAQTLAAMGRAREAEAAYRRWIQRRPSDFGARLEAIHYFVSEGRSDVALEIARGAVRIDPNSADAHLMLGVALDATGDKRGALSELRRAQVLAADAAGRARAQSLVVTLRAGAPDSLRALFAADSSRYEGAQR
jgi:tetratricopeptide (TPR) repeat protein